MQGSRAQFTFQIGWDHVEQVCGLRAVVKAEETTNIAGRIDDVAIRVDDHTDGSVRQHQALMHLGYRSTTFHSLAVLRRCRHTSWRSFHCSRRTDGPSVVRRGRHT